MAVLDPDKTYRNLKKKGFIDSVKHSKDHKYLELYYDNKYILHTKISHGKKDIADYFIAQMARQCKINKKQFMDLANCPLEGNEYITILNQDGIINK